MKVKIVKNYLSLRTLLFVFTFNSLATFAISKDIEMTCRHSFQGNYSGGDVLLKYENKVFGRDKAYIKGNGKWIEICTDVETHGDIQIGDFSASCSIYLANWMNGKRKNFIWDFKTKELHFQTLWKMINPETNKKEWRWGFSVGQVGSSDWKVINGWESEGVRYNKRNCT
tara:strand:- start:30 stop:539 length:510 start_codon:yes stop_codon:yes gene_type:complete